MATKRLRDRQGSIYSMDVLDKGTIPISAGTELDGVRFHGTQFKTYELVISETAVDCA